MKGKLLVVGLALLSTACGGPTASDPTPDHAELDAELTSLLTLDGQRRLATFQQPDSDDLGAIPQDPANPLTPAKVALGRWLFHDPALSASTRLPEHRGTFSCATCHHAAAGFEAGAARSIGEGGSGWGTRGEARRPAPGAAAPVLDSPPLKSQSILNKAWQRVMMYSGAAGSDGPNAGTTDRWNTHVDAGANGFGYQGIESQAIGALGKHRLFEPMAAHELIHAHPAYASLWQEVWGKAPVSAELVGLSIAAFERTVMANRAPFQRWLRGTSDAMTLAEKRGALVFFGREALCADCHTGPALASMAFYALGMPDMPGDPPDRGRGGFTGRSEEEFTYKVPQLYNLTDAAFMGHGSSFRSMREVVDYYVAGVPDVHLPPGRVTNQFHSLTLTKAQIDDLVAFLEGALSDPDLGRYQPPSVPSGGCIPANDPAARTDLGCR
ncbi:MAG: cytochrome-c peroxidase [Bacteroidetes bacterium]|nr:cytochrome-c peroxidase [Bacteroidota bacterium]